MKQFGVIEDLVDFCKKKRRRFYHVVGRTRCYAFNPKEVDEIELILAHSKSKNTRS